MKETAKELHSDFATKASRLNTLEQIDLWTEKVEHDDSLDLAAMMGSWEKIKAKQSSHKYEKNFTPLDSFLSAIQQGEFPSPQVLHSVAECFNHYYEAEGDLELEEVFFSKPVKGVGNMSARDVRDSAYKLFHIHVIHVREMESEPNELQVEINEVKETLEEARSYPEINKTKLNKIQSRVERLQKALYPQKSIQTIAANYFDKFEEILQPTMQGRSDDLDSFITGYRRWRKRTDTKTI